MRRLVTLSAAAVLAAVVSVPAFAANKVGVVDFATVFKSVPQGQSAVKALKADLQPQVEKVKKQQQQLAGKIKDFERNSPTLSKSQRAAQQKTLTDEQNAFEKNVMAIHGQQMKKEHAAAETFQKDLEIAVNEVAKSGHYNMILNAQAAPYYDHAYDVSNAVIGDMKRMH